MRIFVVLICSLGLVSVAYGAQQEENKQKKKQPQTVQHAPAATTAHPPGHPTGAGANPKHTSMEAYHGQQGTYHAQKVIKGQTSTEAYHGQKGIKGHPSTEAYHGQKGNKGQTPMGANEVQTGNAAKGGKVTGAGKPAEAGGSGNARILTKTTAKGKPLKPQHFDLPKQPNIAKAPAVTFQQGRHIEGSQNWQGQQYTVFRNYRSEWRDRDWWDSHYRNNIVFVFGAPYYWNAGYWFPAWGYSPNAYYAWDGPIYAYNHLPPDQVIANVQAALQEQGYYHGEVDGLIGPLTREALANYQRDRGLYETASIDQPTLESLGMT